MPVPVTTENRGCQIPGTAVTDGCEPYSMVVGTKPGSSRKVAKALTDHLSNPICYVSNHFSLLFLFSFFLTGTIYRSTVHSQVVKEKCHPRQWTTVCL